MAYPHRLGLSQETEEEIEKAQRQVHERYWNQLREFQIPETIITKMQLGDVLDDAPIPQPLRLARTLHDYASELIETAALHVRFSPKLREWLAILGDQTHRNITARLGYAQHLEFHLSREQIDDAINDGIEAAINNKLTRSRPSTVRTIDSLVSDRSKRRRAMKESYFLKFPQTMIIDVCWAARQHRREWDRWIKGEIKDGSKPDRLFRAVLTSDKEPKAHRDELRPKDWK